MKINKYGLSRFVPAEIKREIRKRCGFGCVICGLGFYDYEHFDPDFHNAVEHNPAGMTLLCHQCNQKRARGGRLSAHTVAIANANPKCLRQGYANEMFDFHSDPIEIVFGGVSFYDCKHLISVNGTPILSVQPPSEEGAPVLLSGSFCDTVGRETLNIYENEWSVSSEHWDVECEGPRITIRSAPREIVLKLRMNSPHGIVIERLEMLYRGIYFKGNEKIFQFSFDGMTWNKWMGCSMQHCMIGISIESTMTSANDSFYYDQI